MAQETPTSRLIGLYVWAEQTILLALARIIKQVARVDPLMRGITARLLIRRVVNRVNSELAQQTPAMIAALIAEQSGAGGNVPPVPPRNANGQPVPWFDPEMSHGDRAARQIRNDLTSELSDVRYRLTRLDDDIYKAIGPEGAVVQVQDHLTPKQAQAAAWRDFLRHGVTGFTDKSGREWQLSSYVEMAVRTAATRAYNAARMEMVASNGGNELFVSDDGNPCPLCQPWQGRILVITPDGVHPTVDEATAAGLFHPNCKHHLAEHIEGHTQLPEPQEWTPEDQERYNATQKQRALERQIRAAKREALYATTPEARLAATRDVRAAQAKMRAFLHDHENLLRRPHREQPDLSYPTTR